MAREWAVAEGWEEEWHSGAGCTGMGKGGDLKRFTKKWGYRRCENQPMFFVFSIGWIDSLDSMD